LHAKLETFQPDNYNFIAYIHSSLINLYFINNMPPNGQPKIDLEALKLEILQKYHAGSRYDVIALEIGTLEHTLRCRFKEWGIRRRALKVNAEDPELRA
jgi:hypothetical protein